MHIDDFLEKIKDFDVITTFKKVPRLSCEVNKAENQRTGLIGDLMTPIGANFNFRKIKQTLSDSGKGGGGDFSQKFSLRKKSYREKNQKC